MATDETNQIQPTKQVNLGKASSIALLTSQIRRNRPKAGIGTKTQEDDSGTTIDVDLDSLPTVELDVCSGGSVITVTVVGKITG